MRGTINVNETVNIPRGVRVTDSPPPNSEYVNVFKARSGSWKAQHWVRTSNGQLVAEYMADQSSKRAAVEDALHRAQAEGIPFVREVREKEEAMYVESTVIDE